METKKKLRKDLNELKALVLEHEERLKQHCLRIKELEEKKAEEADIISGGEAAKLLGWQSGYVSSTWLDKIGVHYSKGDNGCLKISRKDIEEYLESRKTTTED